MLTIFTTWHELPHPTPPPPEVITLNSFKKHFASRLNLLQCIGCLWDITDLGHMHCVVVHCNVLLHVSCKKWNSLVHGCNWALLVHDWYTLLYVFFPFTDNKIQGASFLRSLEVFKIRCKLSKNIMFFNIGSLTSIAKMNWYFLQAVTSPIIHAPRKGPISFKIDLAHHTFGNASAPECIQN